MFHFFLPLADTSGAAGEEAKRAAQASAMKWAAALLLLVIVGGALVMWYRAKFLKNQTPEEGTGFGLSDLRAMRDRGDLTDAEYDAARAKIAARIKEKAGVAAGELTLPRIKEMFDRGELTLEQYETERKKIIERMKGRA
jgi:predicted O-methyltransferase YrrM